MNILLAKLLVIFFASSLVLLLVNEIIDVVRASTEIITSVEYKLVEGKTRLWHRFLEHFWDRFWPSK